MKKLPRQSTNIVDERGFAPSRETSKRYLQRNLDAIQEVVEEIALRGDSA